MFEDISIFIPSLNKIHENLKDQNFPNTIDFKNTFCPLELFQIYNRDERRFKFQEELNIGDCLITEVYRTSKLKIEMKIIATYGFPVRHLSDLNIKAIFWLNQSSKHEKYSSGDKLLVFVKNLKSPIEVSSDQPHVKNKNNLTHLGHIKDEEIKKYLPTCETQYLTDFMQSSSLQNGFGIKLILSKSSFNPTGVSVMNSVNKVFIDPEATAKNLRKAQLIKESDKYVIKGIEFYRKSEYHEAQICYNHALSIYHNNVDAMVANGALFVRLKSNTLAVKEFKRALEIDPENKNAKKYLKNVEILVTNPKLNNKHENYRAKSPKNLNKEDWSDLIISSEDYESSEHISYKKLKDTKKKLKKKSKSKHNKNKRRHSSDSSVDFKRKKLHKSEQSKDCEYEKLYSKYSPNSRYKDSKEFSFIINPNQSFIDQDSRNSNPSQLKNEIEKQLENIQDYINKHQ